MGEIRLRVSHARPDAGHRLLCLVMGLIAAFLPLLPFTPHPAAQASNGLVVQGVVTDTRGLPVAGAYLQSEGFQATTDRKGQYVLDIPPRQRVMIAAWAPGYNREPVDFSDPSGGVLQGQVRADFTGAFALSNAFRNPTYHATLSGLPVRVSSHVRAVHLHGAVRVSLESRLPVILPDGEVKAFRLRQKGARFQAVVDFPSKGAYWVEVNATTGFAVFNVVVFHGVPPRPPVEPYFPPEPAWKQVTPDQLGEYALFIINNVRQTLGRRPLVMNQDLLRAARAHNRDMIRYGYFLAHPHIGSDGSTPWTRMAVAGFRGRAIGEDVGEADSVGGVITSFLDSAAHRMVLIGRYRWAGIAVSSTNGQLLVTVDLGR